MVRLIALKLSKKKKPGTELLCKMFLDYDSFKLNIFHFTAKSSGRRGFPYKDFHEVVNTSL